MAELGLRGGGCAEGLACGPVLEHFGRLWRGGRVWRGAGIGSQRASREDLAPERPKRPKRPQAVSRPNRRATKRLGQEPKLAEEAPLGSKRPLKRAKQPGVAQGLPRPFKEGTIDCNGQCPGHSLRPQVAPKLAARVLRMRAGSSAPGRGPPASASQLSGPWEVGVPRRAELPSPGEIPKLAAGHGGQVRPETRHEPQDLPAAAGPTQPAFGPEASAPVAFPPVLARAMSGRSLRRPPSLGSRVLGLS